MYNLGNFTIALPSYECDRNCPFCIAKNNRKFKGSSEIYLNQLSMYLKQLQANGINFERIVVSGNGEPSLYELEELKALAKVIKENAGIFDTLRVHTSGNIFFEQEKFDLFNGLVDDVEFDTLRLAIDAERDKKALGYKRVYTKTTHLKEPKELNLILG